MPPTWLGLVADAVFVVCLSALAVMGLKRLLSSLNIDQESELLFQLRLRIRAEASAENQAQLLRALALVDGKRASASFLAALAGNGRLADSVRSEAAAILRSWDAGGIVARAEEVVEDLFEKEP